ncbi:TetR/AcrR family transcriptional regulator [Lactiplantibacillus herbarum]|uniref:TetR/AcrR family transcriptional regulator n=1 Tax=Lactiplantibacillus herbarum TaxID=1670446 RepID=UPI00069CE89E|nr:TetR/AcrR family transcriptional regulator [Lactiplantibacillus herbarum]
MDLRVQRTLKSVEDTFIQLVLKDGFDKVTVVKLAQVAMINPKTFYDHFDDKFDLANTLAEETLSTYSKILDVRLQSIATHSQQTGITPQLTGLLNALLNEPQLKKRWLALSLIAFEGFDLQQQLLATIQQRLRTSGISQDPLEIDIISLCAFKTMDYYIRTGETFSADRQKHLIGLLEQVLAV